MDIARSAERAVKCARLGKTVGFAMKATYYLT